MLYNRIMIIIQVGSLYTVFSQVLKSDGIKGLFSGYYATLVRDVPYTMLELGNIEYITIVINY